MQFYQIQQKKYLLLNNKKMDVSGTVDVCACACTCVRACYPSLKTTAKVSTRVADFYCCIPFSLPILLKLSDKSFILGIRINSNPLGYFACSNELLLIFDGAQCKSYLRWSWCVPKTSLSFPSSSLHPPSLLTVSFLLLTLCFLLLHPRALWITHGRYFNVSFVSERGFKWLYHPGY